MGDTHSERQADDDTRASRPGGDSRTRLSKVAVVLGALAFAAFSGVSCVRGPEYQAPVIDAPATFRGTAPDPDPVSLADTQWPDLLDDPALTRLGARALGANHDLKAAAERVLQARERLGIAGADRVPEVGLSTGFQVNRNSRVGAFGFTPGADTDASYTEAGFRVGWELDVWGRLRSIEDSAEAAYLATEEAGRGVRVALLADVASGYVRLRALDQELDIAERTRSAAEESLRLTQIRKDLGLAAALDVRQAEQLLRTATTGVAAAEREIAEVENLLNFLAGGSPGPIERGKSLSELVLPERVPAGLPSTLLVRRPDIREAERRLAAAHADIGAVRAQLFPLISLTGFLGAQTTALTELFTGPARQWTFNPLANVPIFNRGRLRSEVRLNEAVEREAVATYEQTVQRGFREVADAIAVFGKTTEQMNEQRLLVEALRDSRRLAAVRYEGGVDSFLQVLDAERGLFAAELVEARLRRDVLLSVVDLYRALGGGWE
jgi:multidrug efflux system outer membrane protein